MALTPTEYAECLVAGCPLPTGASIDHLVGRFTRGVCDADFDRLSDEPGKRLTWLCTPNTLAACLGKPIVAALHSDVGFTKSWMTERLADNTAHRLFVFEQEPGKAEVVTWSALWRLVREAYGAEVDAALQPFQREIEETEPKALYAKYDPENRIQHISNLPVADKYAHKGFMSAEALLAAAPRTMYHARAFLELTVGANVMFTGTGLSPSGEPELMGLNRQVADIKGIVSIPLEVTAAAVAALPDDEDT
mmetsp:Transcript_5685/g.14504  ORF Transcript_5685/g.14504 Transcript_5685/m.14504 type:complete len:250 (+) Transcript_5685:289-1038(+)